MALPDNLIESLNIKKIQMATEINISEQGTKAYVVIFPIERVEKQKCKTNLSPIVSYEVRLVKHKDIFIEEKYGYDYDYALEDKTTRIKRMFVDKTDGNHELEKILVSLNIDINDFHQVSYYDSVLLNSPIESYIDNPDNLSHLWQPFV